MSYVSVFYCCITNTPCKQLKRTIVYFLIILQFGWAQLGGSFAGLIWGHSWPQSSPWWLNRAWRVSEAKWQRPLRAQLWYQRKVASATSYLDGESQDQPRFRRWENELPSGHAFPPPPVRETLTKRSIGQKSEIRLTDIYAGLNSVILFLKN